MALPPLVRYATTAEYRRHFEVTYCRGPIVTFDGISVRFRKRQFDHCFFESGTKDGHKDTFSCRRAERIDWIRHVLASPEAELYQGWDSTRRRHDPNRRVAVVLGEYVVIIVLTEELMANFVTAFVADPPQPGRLSTIQKIRRGPRWQRKDR